MSSAVYVSRLPHYVRDWELKKHFQQFGTVVSVRLNPARSGNRSGFVNFADASGAQRALAVQYPVFLGRRITVSHSTAEVKSENPYTYSASCPPKPPQLSSVSTVPAQPHAAVVKVEPELAPQTFTVKAEPGVLRPADESVDPYQHQQFSVSRPPVSADSYQKSKFSPGSQDPFQKSQFSVSSPPASQDPFQKSQFPVSCPPSQAADQFKGPRVQSVSGTPTKTKKEDNRRSSADKSFNEQKRVPVKRRSSEGEKEKIKKKVMSVGSLKLPQSAADFVEANKKLYEEKFCADDSPEDVLPPEIVEEKKRIVKVLNTGSSDKLQRLQLIGKKKADAIIAYRRLRGKFRKIEDLSKIALFGDQFTQKFKEANFIS